MTAGVVSHRDRLPKHVAFTSTLRSVSQATPLVEPVVANRSLPASLQIPKLGIDRPIQYMGRTKNGTMAVPTDVINTGWYKFSVLPGNIGSAVIAGHLDDLRGQPGVFSNLGKLQAGDTLSVMDTAGREATFIVRTTHLYGEQEQPSEVFTSSNNIAHLNLITCGGAWDKTAHHYQKRLVVFTDRID